MPAVSSANSKLATPMFYLNFPPGSSRKIEEKRARERERYRCKKAAETRQTRRSCADETPGPSAKRPRDMSTDELWRYKADQHKRQRDNLSSQKKTAIN
ncbi:hypothetical protein RRG08_020346 [Elysia crispata]|uniref:Uncharacterized protein n=1 Tax=Elysia crispata TaxID=231223 RepID=A0AAE1B6Z0_9GAST|nr:hypothetical protein RRG08_020346 [Elysia crispata]